MRQAGGCLGAHQRAQRQLSAQLGRRSAERVGSAGARLLCGLLTGPASQQPVPSSHSWLLALQLIPALDKGQRSAVPTSADNTCDMQGAA